MSSYLRYAGALLIIACFANATCFFPNGTERPNLSYANEYQPCKSSGASMCCGTGRTQFADTCQPTGLCWHPATGLLWRESCTDPTWKDPACLQLCNSGYFGATDMSTTDVVVTSCPDGSYCCGNNSTACCQSQSGYWILNSKVYPYKSLPTAGQMTDTTTTSVPPSSYSGQPGQAQLPAQSKLSSSSSTNVALGVGLGVGIPLIFLLAGCFWFLIKRRNSSNMAKYDDPITPVERRGQLVELDGEKPPITYELSSERYSLKPPVQVSELGS